MTASPRMTALLWTVTWALALLLLGLQAASAGAHSASPAGMAVHVGAVVLYALAGALLARRMGRRAAQLVAGAALAHLAYAGLTAAGVASEQQMAWSDVYLSPLVAATTLVFVLGAALLWCWAGAEMEARAAACSRAAQGSGPEARAAVPEPPWDAQQDSPQTESGPLPLPATPSAPAPRMEWPDVPEFRASTMDDLVGAVARLDGVGALVLGTQEGLALAHRGVADAEWVAARALDVLDRLNSLIPGRAGPAVAVHWDVGGARFRVRDSEHLVLVLELPQDQGGDAGTQLAERVLAEGERIWAQRYAALAPPALAPLTAWAPALGPQSGVRT